MKKMHIPLFHVNAFTERAFRGNPAAVCLLNSWLDDNWLRKVAAENNVSATAFLVSEGDDYDVRWFTPRCEIRLCGHATLASADVVFNVLETSREAVQFRTKFSGKLTVHEDNGSLSMDFPALVPKPCATVPPGLSHVLGRTQQPSDVLEVNNILIAVLTSQDAVQNFVPDFLLLEKLHPYAVVLTAPGEDVDFVSRYFAPGYGVPEDAVTGSAHCALAPYWTNRLKKSRLHARQLSERGGELWCEVAGERAILIGKTVLTMAGSLTI
jgi:PhzF family phenazine biosynthesis protein